MNKRSINLVKKTIFAHLYVLVGHGSINSRLNYSHKVERKKVLVVRTVKLILNL